MSTEFLNLFCNQKRDVTYYKVYSKKRPTLNGLSVDPCLPSDMEGFTATRQYRGATYDIKVTNEDHAQKGIKAFLVDGKPIEGHVIPYDPDKKHYQVEIIM